MKHKVILFNPHYHRYRKMWKEDRWQFSGTLVQLTIKENKGNLTDAEKYMLETLNQIIDEHDGNWLEGYMN